MLKSGLLEQGWNRNKHLIPLGNYREISVLSRLVHVSHSPYGEGNIKTDLYTEIVLTVIAVSLIWIGINMTPSVFANKQEMVDVNIVKVSDRFIGPAVPVVQK